MGNSRNLDLKAIRQKAEALVAEKNITLPENITPDLETVFQELSVHQIELEIQNEELRAIQQALESSHANYASLFNQAPCGYLILDASNLVVKANQTFIDMLHLGKDDLKEKAFVDFLTDASRPVFLGQYKAFFNHPEGKRINLEIKRPDGSFFYAAIFGSREVPESENQAEKFQHIRIAVLNISEQRRAEIALAESYTELNLRHQVAEIMLKFDDRMMYGQILTLLLEFFAAGSGFFAYLDEEQSLIMAALEGFRLPDLSAAQKNQDPHLSPEQWQDLWGKSLREKRSLYRNFNPELNEGESANICAVPILHQGQLLGQICLKNRAGSFNQDIERNLNQVCTLIAPVLAARLQRDREEKRRLETEEQLRQAQRMESIGVLAGGIAHDFNNILTPIIGYTEMLLANCDKNHPEHNDLQQISDSAYRARDLVAQLLAFSRKQMLDIKPLDLNQCLLGLEKMLRRLLRENIKLSFFLDENVGLIKADRSSLDQIIINLAVNAQDAMPDGGKLTITTDKRYFNGNEDFLPADFSPGEYAVIQVSDDGSGINKQIIDKIFEPFFTTKVKGHGTGMGLASCYGIAKQHKGHIWVSSEVGHGSIFTVIFPLADENRDLSSPPRTMAAAKESRGETILLVEDDKSVREMTALILDSLGYLVISAASPAACLELIRDPEVSYDLLLTDVIMPGLNGRELYFELLKINPRLKCLFMSGYTDIIISEIDGAGKPANFIAKPFTISELSKKLREIFESSQAQRRS